MWKETNHHENSDCLFLITRLPYALFSLLLVVLSGCVPHPPPESPGEPPVTERTEPVDDTKNVKSIDQQAELETETDPKQGGLLISFEIPEKQKDEIGSQQALTLTGVYYHYSIDGNKILSHDTSRSVEKFVPLSGGNHELIVTEGLQGLLTFGAERVQRRCEYTFEIEAGQTGSFTATISDVTSNKDQPSIGYEIRGFRNVVSWQLTDSMIKGRSENYDCTVRE